MSTYKKDPKKEAKRNHADMVAASAKRPLKKTVCASRPVISTNTSLFQGSEKKDKVFISKLVMLSCGASVRS